MSHSFPSFPSRGPSVPSVMMTAMSWPSTPPFTPPLRSWKPCRRWCPPSSAPSNTSPIGWIRAAAVTSRAASTANRHTAQRRMILASQMASRLVTKRRIPATATGAVAATHATHDGYLLMLIRNGFKFTWLKVPFRLVSSFWRKIFWEMCLFAESSIGEINLNPLRNLCAVSMADYGHEYFY